MTYQAIIHDSHISRWRAFNHPIEIVQSNKLSEVLPLFEYIEKQALAGYWAVGFISYEASQAFEDSASTLPDLNFPKIWFAIFAKSEILELPKSANNFYLGPWQAEMEADVYLDSVSKIKGHIKRGDTYQTNLTFRQKATFQGSDIDCFLAFIERQSTEYGAYLNCGDFSICSASPELFFSKNGTKIITKPMKGTAERRQDDKEDKQISENLRHSLKERSENVMIVDMIRNDLSRIALDKSVNPLSLFDLEPFETLWQMTSTIEAHSEKSIVEILSALFPCASITGAPKCSTMKIISQIEKSPRQIYTGCIGLLSPGAPQIAQFSVAIRTMLIDQSKHLASYGVGSGIVWDCDSLNEYQECLLKAQATPNSPQDFALLETMLWTLDTGFYLLEPHLERLESSAKFFNFQCDKDTIRKYLINVSKDWPAISYKVRLLLSLDGGLRHEILDFIPSERALKVAISQSAVNSQNIYLLHKTTERSIYNAALKEFDEYDDVILWNEKEEITETCIGNIAYRFEDKWFTPPISSGLLNGVYRQTLINEGKLIERIFLKTELEQVKEIAILNSVRGWTEAEYINQDTDSKIVLL